MVTFGIASREQNEVATGHLMRHSRAVIGFWLMHLIPHREEVAAIDRRPVLRGRGRGRARGGRRRRLPALGGPPRPRGHRRAADHRQAAAGPVGLSGAATLIGRMTTFQELGLKPEVLTTLDELGYTEPTAIQEQAIPELLAGHDVIGQAQTGHRQDRGLRPAAPSVPRPELAGDPGDRADADPRALHPGDAGAARLRRAPRTSRSSPSSAARRSRPSSRGFARGAHVVVATVGRMMDLISRRSLVLTSARYVVLDEADEMLDLGFIEDVEKILRMCPSGRQTSLFSATMPPPIARLAETVHVRPGDDQGDAEAAHRRRDRAGLRRGRATREDRPADRGSAGRGARAGDHLLPDQDRRGAARQRAARQGPAQSRRCTAI